MRVSRSASAHISLLGVRYLTPNMSARFIRRFSETPKLENCAAQTLIQIKIVYTADKLPVIQPIEIRDALLKMFTSSKPFLPFPMTSKFNSFVTRIVSYFKRKDIFFRVNIYVWVLSSLALAILAHPIAPRASPHTNLGPRTRSRYQQAAGHDISLSRWGPTLGTSQGGVWYQFCFPAHFGSKVG